MVCLVTPRPAGVYTFTRICGCWPSSLQLTNSKTPRSGRAARQFGASLRRVRPSSGQGPREFFQARGGVGSSSASLGGFGASLRRVPGEVQGSSVHFCRELGASLARVRGEVGRALGGFGHGRRIPGPIDVEPLHCPRRRPRPAATRAPHLRGAQGGGGTRRRRWQTPSATRLRCVALGRRGHPRPRSRAGPSSAHASAGQIRKALVGDR